MRYFVPFTLKIAGKSFCHLVGYSISIDISIINLLCFFLGTGFTRKIDMCLFPWMHGPDEMILTNDWTSFIWFMWQLSRWIISHKWTVGELWNMLVEYSTKRVKGETSLGFFTWLLPSLSTMMDIANEPWHISRSLKTPIPLTSVRVCCMDNWPQILHVVSQHQQEGEPPKLIGSTKWSYVQ